jgi:acetoin utilization protein AcuA
VGEIVGQVSLVAADGWWKGLENIYEIGIEVSSGWRRLNIAHSLPVLALASEAVEDMIIMALGLALHWDLKGLGLDPLRYRELIAQLAAAYGFIEYPTSEPNVRSDPANILLARIGTRVNRERISQFFLYLLRSDDTDL